MFKSEAPCLTQSLLHPGHEHLQKQLRLLQEAPAKKKEWDSNTITIHRNEWYKRGGRWLQHKPDVAGQTSP
eukprot:6956738-Lingulodinium_polyedra.AAC.1